MQFPTLLLSVVSLITLSEATEVSRPALMDSTILRSTVSCPECPERNCYKCTLGHNETLQANTGGLAYVRSLIGFKLPVPAKQVTKCTIQTPAFTKLPQFPINVTVAAAKTSKWNEDTVDGENSPDSGEVFNTVNAPALSNLPAFDVTPACKSVSKDRQFSIYLGAESGSFAIWSKDSGNPAILHITYED
ncbi:hypothetical protein NW767_014844 [Fusarium falciforme]|nr:hypothetical protein NW767_014844 [Fusarium falciforme]KAJ4223950.1 hypothetical protein NW757_014361 [Fusarium falciforme]